MNDKKIVIIGAGVSGLVAALELEEKGYAPIILESTDRVGGRVKTDHDGGYRFDHGFQVLLTAYPEAKKYLDYNRLKLKNFKLGAIIHGGSKPYVIADPLRQFSSLFSVISSPVGTISDKWKMWRLTQVLKGKSIDAIFEEPSISTLDYLRNFGFSARVIDNFFKPFFGGIFLEDELLTSSRLFQFIFKMFSEGFAAIPEAGMEAIPDQLSDNLKHTKIEFGTEVDAISEQEVHTSNGVFAYDRLIVTVPPKGLLPEYQPAETEFQSTINVYFSIPRKTKGVYIELIPTADKGLINNFCLISNASSLYAEADKSLLSVSVLGAPNIPTEELIMKLTQEIASRLEIEPDVIHFLKEYRIQKALPMLGHQPSMKLSKNAAQHSEKIYLAGDYLLGGSLNAAMASGRQCVDHMVSEM